MAKSGFVNTNEKIAEKVVQTYQKIENTVVGGYTKIEDIFVDRYLTKDGESIEEAKARLKRRQDTQQQLTNLPKPVNNEDEQCKNWLLLGLVSYKNFIASFTYSFMQSAWGCIFCLDRQSNNNSDVNAYVP